MTYEEAVAFVEQAQNLPPAQIDLARLEEAIRVIAREDGVAEDVAPVLEAIRQAHQARNQALRESPAVRLVRGRAEMLASAWRAIGQAISRFRESAGEFQAEHAFTPREGQTTTNPILWQAMQLAEQAANPQAPPSGGGPGRQGPPSGRPSAPVAGSADPAVRRITVGTAPPSRVEPHLRLRLTQVAEFLGIPPDQVRAEITRAEEAETLFRSAPPEQQEVMAQSGAITSAREYLERLLFQWMEEAGPIGVPPGYVARRTINLDAADRVLFSGRPTQAEVEVGPRYFEESVYNFAGRPPEEITRIQRRLYEAGLLDEDYWPGMWDNATMSAMRTAMGLANLSGQNLDATLNYLRDNLPESIAEQRRLADAAKVFQEPPYLEPDPAALAQDVRGLFRQRLGRDPRPGELSEFASILASLDQQAYQQEVAIARGEFYRQDQAPTPATEQTVLAGAGGTIPSVPSSMPGPTYNQVDPVARFNQIFEERYGPELSFIEDRAAAQQNMANVFASLRTMSALVGGR